MIKILLFSILTNLFYYCLGSLILLKKKNTNYSCFYKALIGVIIASFIGLLLNFIAPLNSNTNSLLFIAVILIFLIKFKLFINKKEVIFLAISSLICFFLILLSNVNRPDAGLYHLPYVAILNEYKIIFGLNNLHSRFGHVSIIQYLSALNNNYFFKENGIVIPLASIVAFYYIYFSNEVIKIYKKKKEINSSSLFSLLVLTYIFFKITGYDGFGNDAVAHLSFFYLISYILKLQNKFIDIKFIILISVFIFLNKSTMIFVFIIPLIIMYFKYRLNLIKIFTLTKSFPVLFLLLWLTKNLIISGCIIYPVTFTCLESLPWLNMNSTISENIASESWSKAWPENSNIKFTMEIFIENFNWIDAWSKKHLIYIAKIIIPYTITLLLIFLYLHIYSKNLGNKIIIIKISKFFWLTFFTCSVGSIFFFIKFPLYRYGYSYLISFFILIFIYFIRTGISRKRTIYICKFIFFLSIVIFVGKQSHRIIQKNNLDYINKPWPKIYSFDDNKKINTKKYYINDNFTYYLSINDICMYSDAPCTNYNIDEKLITKTIFGYTLLIYQ
jgi:hypothetical protein